MIQSNYLNHDPIQIAVFTVFVTPFAPTVHSQTNRMTWGIEGGPNLSTLILKKQKEFIPDTKVFYSGGISVQYNFKKIFSIGTGLAYQEKGYQRREVTYTNNWGVVEAKLSLASKFRYLTLPLLVKASFGKKVQYFVNAGAYTGYLIALRESITVIYPEFHSSSANIKDLNGFKQWDFGISTGIGMAVPVKSWLFSLEVRNNSGILNIMESSKYIYRTNTTDLRVGIAYRFGFRDSE